MVSSSLVVPNILTKLRWGCSRWRYVLVRSLCLLPFVVYIYLSGKKLATQMPDFIKPGKWGAETERVETEAF